ncbi:hypothetical protein QTO34_005625 [Cnephaeus nilssonii]|uniref:RNase H type-1 domain-containing protein n=1 Tax=Cnephaeus nilssonii TaxID=3371016 RepID=A0AA40LK55_CNENI|nr:hypothetical protein QTO34_005625 [Eptesicus nilssonii]
METLLRSPPERWLSNARITQYHVLLLDPPRVSFLKTAALNPATLLPDDDPEQPLHNCVETLSLLKNLREDLTDQPLRDPDETLYTMGAASWTEGPADKVIWAQALGHGTSAQKAELIALTQALRWAKGKTVHIYTDSRYAFTTFMSMGPLSGKGTTDMGWGGGEEEIKTSGDPRPPGSPLAAKGSSSHTLTLWRREETHLQIKQRKRQPPNQWGLYISCQLSRQRSSKRPLTIQRLITNWEGDSRLRRIWKRERITRHQTVHSGGPGKGTHFSGPSEHPSRGNQAGLEGHCQEMPRLCTVNPGRHSPLAQGTRLRGRSPWRTLGSRL